MGRKTDGAVTRGAGINRLKPTTSRSNNCWWVMIAPKLWLFVIALTHRVKVVRGYQVEDLTVFV